MRTLTLRSERLAELTRDELAGVVGAAATIGVCPSIPDQPLPHAALLTPDPFR
ncbi:MAG TPA: hypothetical protein VFQ85_15065 [Mycobacteriales bacterium]|jgi:hypothetical protein|nr:hypothetical protein [Mycobacteriales bacterium]